MPLHCLPDLHAGVGLKKEWLLGAVDFELSLVGDVRGTGEDVIRIVERDVHPDPDRFFRRTKHYDVRSGALIGSRVINAPRD